MSTRRHNLSGLVSELRAQSQRVDAMLHGVASSRIPDGSDDGDDARTCGAEATVVLTAGEPGEPPESSAERGADAPDVRWFADNGESDATPSPFFFAWTGGEMIDESAVASDAAGITTSLENDDSTADPPAGDSTLSDSPGGAEAIAASSLPIESSPTSEAPPPPQERAIEPSAARACSGVAPAPRTSRPRPTRPPLQPFATASDSSSPIVEPLEVRIGRRWMAWIGTITVLVAIAILARLALVEAWFGPFSRVACTALAMMLGGALLGGGEAALRRRSPVAAQTLFGAGLAILALTTLLAHRLFAVSNPLLTLAACLSVTVLGLLLRRRANGPLMTLAVAALTYAPLLAGDVISMTPLVRGVYLTAALIAHLAARIETGDERDWPRYLIVGLHTLAAWPLLAADGVAAYTALSFAGVWWGAVLAQSTWLARRDELPLGNAAVLMTATALLALFSYAALVASGVWPPQWFGGALGAAALVIAGIALLMDRGRALRGLDDSAKSLLAASLWIQSGVLIAAALAMSLGGAAQTLALLLLAVAGVEAGRRLSSRGLSVYGLMLGALAAARVMLLDTRDPSLAVAFWTGGYVTITRWSVLAAGALLAAQVAAVRYRCSDLAVSRTTPVSLSVASVGGWLALCAAVADGPVVTAGWLMVCALLLALEQVGGRLRYLETALAVLVLTAGRWILEQLWHAAAGALQTQHPLWNPDTALALAIAITGLWAGRLLRARVCSAAERAKHERWQGPDGPWQAALVGGAVFLLLALHQDVRRLWLALAPPATTGAFGAQWIGVLQTMVWALGALGIGLIARRLAVRQRNGVSEFPKLLARAAWTIAAACAVKWLVVDCWVGVWLVGVTGGGLGMPVVNLRMLAGLLVAGVVIGLYVGLRTAARVAVRVPDNGYKPASLKIAAWIPVGVGLLLTAGITTEFDELLSRFDPDAPVVVHALWRTLLWAIAGTAMLSCGRWPGWKRLFDGGWALLAIATMVWLIFDTLFCHLMYGSTAWPAIVNPQFLVGVALALCLLVALRVTRILHERSLTDSDFVREARIFAHAAIAAIGLWLGTLEIDRLFDAAASDAAMARQTALSAFWAAYGVVLVAAGFLRAAPAQRVAGLALLSIALGKVLLVDLSELAYVYRALSLLAVGLLLVGTSLAYSRLSSSYARRATIRRQ